MKKSILSILGLAVSALAVGQNLDHEQITAEKTVAAPAVLNHTAVNKATRAVGQLFFEETFGNGLAGDGTNGAWTLNGIPSAAVWEYRGTATNPDVTVGSRGNFAGPGGAPGSPIASPTAANGFFIFDSDYLDQNGIAPAPHQGWLISPTFSTVGAANIVIDFTTYFRRYVGDGYVLLSNDDGVTWGDTIEVFGPDNGVNDGDAVSALDELMHFEANFLGNSATAKVAFYFDGATNSGSSGPGYYHFQIDDFSVSEAPDFDLVLDQQIYDNRNFTDLWGYYTMMPNFIAEVDTITFSGEVSNAGSATNTGVTLTNDIGTPTGTLSLSSNSVSLAAGAEDSLVIGTDFVFEDGAGLYTWAFSVNGDSIDDVPSNNASDTVEIMVTDTTYARDRNASGDWSFTNATSSYEMAMLYDVKATMYATSISCGFGANTPVGSVVSVFIYDVVNGEPNNKIVSRPFMVLADTDIDTVATFAIPKTELTPGQYFVAFESPAGVDVTWFNSDSDPDNGTVFVKIDGGAFGPASALPILRLNGTDCSIIATVAQTGNTEGTVTVTNGQAPYTYLWSNGETTETATNLPFGINTVEITDATGCSQTLAVDIINGIQEAGFAGNISLFPNPNNGNFQLALEGVEAGAYTLTVKNVVGQTVFAKNISVASVHTENVEVSNLSKGIYFMNIENNSGQRSVVKFIVE